MKNTNALITGLPLLAQTSRLAFLICLFACLLGSPALAQAPSRIQGLAFTYIITAGTYPFAGAGSFATYSTGTNVVVFGDRVNVADGKGTYRSFTRNSATLATVTFTLESGTYIEGITYLTFNNHKSGTFYMVSTLPTGGIMYGTFTCSGTAITYYDYCLYFLNQATTTRSTAANAYLGNYLYNNNLAFAGYFYTLWDSADSSRAVAVYTAYKNAANTWYNKYTYNNYFNYFNSLSSTYYNTLLATNPRQANYYKNAFLAYAYYYYWLREGNSTNANGAYNYFLNIAKTFA